MWILWKVRFSNCEFSEKWDFQNVISWISCGFLPGCPSVRAGQHTKSADGSKVNKLKTSQKSLYRKICLKIVQIQNSKLGMNDAKTKQTKAVDEEKANNFYPNITFAPSLKICRKSIFFGNVKFLPVWSGLMELPVCFLSKLQFRVFLCYSSRRSRRGKQLSGWHSRGKNVLWLLGKWEQREK